MNFSGLDANNRLEPRAEKPTRFWNASADQQILWRAKENGGKHESKRMEGEREGNALCVRRVRVSKALPRN